MARARRTQSFDLEEATLGGIQRALRARRVSARELVQGYLQRIESLDRRGPRLNAIVNVNPRALAQAVALDQALAKNGRLQGPLHGIPILLKDNIETADVPTTFGSAAFADYLPAQDATVVRKLRAAGAIVLGKTTLPDFATSWWAYSSMSGETRNPYDLARDPGGSSAGTGAAVAANLGAIGLGTDCGGSIRVPASCNNLVGIRSTPGVISRDGASLLVFPQDTIGPMARTVRDAVTLFELMSGYDPADPLTVHAEIAGAPRRYGEALDAAGLKKARIGLVTNALGSDHDPFAAPVNARVRESAAAIMGAGGTVIDVQIPDLAHHLAATSMYVNCSKHDINSFLAARPEAPLRTLNQIYENRRYHPMLDLVDACVVGPELPEYDPQYFRRLAAREQFQRVVLNLLSQHRLEALVFPDVQVVPPTREQLNTRVWTTLTFPTNTLISSQTWLPSMSVPAGLTDDGLPVGLEFVTRPYAEPLLFRLGYAFEQAT
ncbi:MAG: amidase, partial [Gammaproteobacteria bacterium]